MTDTRDQFDYTFLMNEFRLLFDASDPWGHTMHCWFGVAGELYHRGEDIPNAWNYGPGSGDPRLDNDDYFREVLNDATPEALQKFGDLLTRYAGKLKRAGMSY